MKEASHQGILSKYFHHAKQILVIKQKTLHPLILKDNAMLDGLATKIKLKVQAYFTMHFKFWKGTSVKT